MDAKFNFNKTEKFDFGKVGKRMPYSTPDDFFKDMEANILNAVKDDTPQPVRIEPRKRSLIRWMWVAALAVAASVAVLLVLNIDFTANPIAQPSSTQNEVLAVDQAFSQLSPADQVYLLNVYQEDVFLNE